MEKGSDVDTQNDCSPKNKQMEISFGELARHNRQDDQWLMIEGKVYDVTEFGKRHPGGARILNHYAGEDATNAWVAFHNNKEKVRRHMKPLCVGTVSDVKQSEINEDFMKLREFAEKQGWFTPDPKFYILHLASVLAIEPLCVALLSYFGTGWGITGVVILLLTAMQAQAGWTMHDYGHHSVFTSSAANHVMHHFVVGFIKGASSRWWNFRHNQHHAKPNRLKKDPDTDLNYIFLLGNDVPVKLGNKKKGFLPYHWQHTYFFLIVPPFLLPIYFHYEVLYFNIKRRNWLDLALIVAFAIRTICLFYPYYGLWGALALYLTVRFVESHWFTWVTQMSHLSQDVTWDTKNLDWPTIQIKSSINVEPGVFNDWFTGHLDYQIEHHLFPTMPRCNFHKVAPLVKSFCKKHDLKYNEKTLFTAWADIVRQLKKSGQLWYDAYYG